MILFTGSIKAQNVVPATGGTNISADNFATGNWTSLNGPTVSETAPGQFQEGQIRLEAPTGFEWDTGGTAPSITITAARALRITVTLVSRTATEIVFQVTGNSAGRPPNNIHTFTFNNLRIRPTQGTPLVSGIIRNTGASIPGGNISYGNLSIIAGADALIRVETAPDNTGSVVQEQDLEAGTTLTVHSNVRDQFGNFKRNQSATWSLQNISGDVVTGDLTASGSSATLTGNRTGTANIQAEVGSLTPVGSGVITVIPTDPAELFIQTPPPATATAGIPFSPQPEIYILDSFSNLVTFDDFSDITASVSSGNGLLGGTTTVRANNGIAQFTDLNATLAETITIEFNSPGINPVSSTLTILPAAADSLAFAVQPSNASLNTPLDPAVEVQLLDTFGNEVSQSGTTVLLNLNNGSGNISGNSSSTNSNGRALFSSLSFDQTGLKSIVATASGLDDSEPSNNFTIANAGELAGFQILSAGGATLSEQTAGTAFDIRILAVDGFGNILDGTSGRDNFSGTVDLSSNNGFLAGTDTTAIGPFVNGVFDPAQITLTLADSNATITATNAAGTESGSSDPFIVNPANALADSSFFTIGRDTLIAGGDTTLISVILRDDFGNRLTSGGDNVTISLSGTGSLSPVNDNGDGTYSAILTSPASTGSATVNVTLDGDQVLSADPEVTYTFGDLDSFLIESSGGGPVTDQTAGAPFDIRITAQDAFGNIVTEFDSVNASVIISSSSDILQGQGTTPDFEDGILSSLTISLASAGINTISARRTAGTLISSSNSFTVLPAAPDVNQSEITTSSGFLEANGTDNAIITLTLIDPFGNQQISGGENVQFSTTAGSLSGVTDNGDGTYTSVLTANTVNETATVSATLNGTPVVDQVQVSFSIFNIWDGNGGGNPSGRTDWGNASRWSLGLPTTGQIVLIPSGQTYYPIIDGEDPVLDFLVIESGASVIMNGRTLTINTEIIGGGSLVANNGNVNLLRVSAVANLIAGTSNVVFSGTNPGSQFGDLTAQQIIFDNDVSVSGFVESNNDLNVSTGRTLNLRDNSTLRITGNLNLNGAITGNGTTIELGGDLNGGNITITDSDLILDGTDTQFIRSFDQLSNLTIDNPSGVIVEDDLIVSDTLFISDGVLTINSGNSLVSNTKTGLVSNIRILREITGSQGWRLLSSPINTDYGNFLDGVITQGYSGAFYSTGSLPGDTLQPNVIWYDETFAGTDNQRFRAPVSASETVIPGRGHFVYLFDDIPSDPLYNDPLPDTLNVLGAENEGNGFSFRFPVTYTPEADTGWNLVGNPFAATIDWDDGNWTKQNMDNVLYVWDESTNDYLTWNGTAGSLGEGKIKPFQAFWVKANGNGPPRLLVDKQTKTTGGTFYKQNREDKPVIEFRLQSGDLLKTTHLSFQSGGSYGKDSLDAYRLLPFDTDTFLELYTLFRDGSQLAINNLPRDFGIKVDIPLYIGGFQEGRTVDGPFTLSWPEFRDVPESWTILLTDRVSGTYIDLRDQTEYSFNLNGSRQKQSFRRNTLENFELIRKTRSKAADSRFFITVDPGEDAAGLPDRYQLYNNYPNPFNASTTIRFANPLEGPVTLEVYDILGRKIATLADRNFAAGFHDINWNSSGLASGVYIYRLVTEGGVFVKKMSLIK